jgi:hypothetical protein
MVVNTASSRRQASKVTSRSFAPANVPIAGGNLESSTAHYNYWRNVPSIRSIEMRDRGGASGERAVASSPMFCRRPAARRHAVIGVRDAPSRASPAS